MSTRAWMGTEWQDYCLLLLRQRYDNHSLQEVPDRHGGDLGIEAFSHDGCVFQCYAAEEPLSTNDLYEAQRDKLTEDLAKLKKNESKLKTLLGPTVIHKYVFLVHRLDSRNIVSHASTKSLEVRAQGLSIVANDFQVMVATDNYYAKERDGVFAVPSPLVDPDPVEVADREYWQASHASLVDGVTSKLRAIGLTGAALDAYMEALLTQYLEGENALAKLRSRYPDQWRVVVRVKSQKEKRLAIEHPPHAATNTDLVTTVTNAMVEEVRRDAPAVPDSLATTLAWSAVADWLMRCPLQLGDST